MWNLLWRTIKQNQFISYNTWVSFNCKYDRQINTWKSNDVYNLRFSFFEKYLFIENAMVIYKALQIITCQRLNICRQVLFTEVEMLDIIVYKTSCFFTRYLPGFYDPKSISMRLSDIREFELWLFTWNKNILIKLHSHNRKILMRNYIVTCNYIATYRLINVNRRLKTTFNGRLSFEHLIL